MFYYIPQILYDLYNSHENYTNIANKLACLLEVVRRSDKDAVLLCSVTSEMTSKTEVRSTNFDACGTAWTTWSRVGDLMPTYSAAWLRSVMYAERPT